MLIIIHGACVWRPRRPCLASTAPASCVRIARVGVSYVQLKIASYERSVSNSVRKCMLGETEM